MNVLIFFEKVQNNLYLYILFFGGIIIVANVIVYLIGLLAGKKETKMHIIVTLATSCIILPLFEFSLPAIFPFTNHNTENTSTNLEVLTEYRYDPYDDAAIEERIIAINNDLQDEGKEINPDDMRAFIYAMNGDYSLLKNQETFYSILHTFLNVDIDSINIIRHGLTTNSDTVTILDSLADIFCNPMEYEMVLYWQNRYNDLKKEIFRYGPTEDVINQIDMFCLDLHHSIMGGEPIQISPSKKSSMYNLSDEAKFFIMACVAPHAGLMITSPDGGAREDQLLYDTISYKNVYIDVRILGETISNYQTELVNEITSEHFLCEFEN